MLECERLPVIAAHQQSHDHRHGSSGMYEHAPAQALFQHSSIPAFGIPGA
jgi:hypothetical protein